MTSKIDLLNDYRHENNKLCFFIEVHNEDADQLIRPLILICTSSSFLYDNTSSFYIRYFNTSG